MHLVDPTQIFFNFAILWIMTFSKTTKDMLLQSYVLKLFSVDEHAYCFVGRKHGLNLEFDYDRLESECKANFILKTWSVRVSWGFASPIKILLFSETKRIKPQISIWEGHLKNKQEITFDVCNVWRYFWFRSHLNKNMQLSISSEVLNAFTITWRLVVTL